MIIWEEEDNELCGYVEHYNHGTFQVRVGSIFKDGIIAFAYLDLYDIEIMAKQTFESLDDAKRWVEKAYLKLECLHIYIGTQLGEIADIIP